MTKKKLKELEQKFQESQDPADEIAYLKAKIELSENSDVKNDTVDIATAIANAIEKKNLPVMRKTKQYVNDLIICDEVILERSETGKGDFRIVETLREGIKITKKHMEVFNQSILKQNRCKALMPQKNKENFIKQL